MSDEHNNRAQTSSNGNGNGTKRHGSNDNSSSGKGRHASKTVWTRALTFINRAVFTLLFLAIVVLLAVLSQRYSITMDWTASARNTLSEASVAVLKTMPERIHIRAFVSDNEQLRQATAQILRRYQRAHSSVTLEFIDPQREPREAERLGVRNDGELVIEYLGLRENVSTLSEAQLTNAFARLARGAQRWAAVLTGRGERDFLGNDRSQLGQFAQHLRTLGVRNQPVTIGSVNAIADNANVVIVLQPSTPWSDEDFRPLKDWVSAGGNVLWLADASGVPLTQLAQLLGIRPEPGMVIDPSSRLNGQATPEFVVVSGYGSHPLTEALPTFSAFPSAASLAWEAPAGWKFTGIATTGLRAWRETGDLTKAVRFDSDEDAIGPLDVAVAASRPHPSGQGEQRIVVFGDIDFLSNAYLGLGANRALGSNAFNWLNADDQLLSIPVVMANDLDYNPSQFARAIIALGAPIALPLILITYGLLRWRARRMR